MHLRIRSVVATALLAALVTGCASAPQAPATVAAASRTPRPTFTPTRQLPTPDLTIKEPTAVAKVAAPTVAPVATAAPTVAAPTAAPAATTKPKAMATIRGTGANIRSGPGTNYPIVAEVDGGQQYEITGKNMAGDWWQISVAGKPGWVSASLVDATNAGAVALAPDLPAEPTAAPRPTAAPQPTAGPQPTARPQPTAAPPPPAAMQFRVDGTQTYPGSGERVEVWCLAINRAVTAVVSGAIHVTGPGGTRDVSFGDTVSHAYTGQEMQFNYNTGCKIELPGAAGSYTAYLVSGGKQVSDPITFTAGAGNNWVFLLKWLER